MLVDATIAGGRENVEDNPTTKLSRAIQCDKGILLTETHHACPETSQKWKPALMYSSLATFSRNINRIFKRIARCSQEGPFSCHICIVFNN